jgi:hypothetical protein
VVSVLARLAEAGQRIRTCNLSSRPFPHEKLRVIFARLYPALPVTPEETAGRHLAAVGDNHLDLPVFRCFLDLIPAEGADVQD